MDQHSKSISRFKFFIKNRLEKSQSIFKNHIGPILAIIIAYFAQYVLNGKHENLWIWITDMNQNQRLLLSAGLYLLAIILWVYFPPKSKPKVEEYNHEKAENHMNLSHRKIHIFLLIISGTIYLLNILLFGLNGESTIIRILWVLSLIAFFLSLSNWPNQTRQKKIEDGKSPSFRLENWIILGLLLAFSFWLRSYQLAIIPDDFHGDMASHGLQARELLSGVEQNIFKFGWADIPMLGFLPAFFSMSIFGNNLFGLQMTSVLGGTISILAIYLLVWRLFDNHRLATITGVLVAINIPHLHFSRIAEYIDPWPIGILALFFFVDGIRSKRWLPLGLAGILTAFSSLMYYSGRVIPIIIAFFFLFLLFNKKSWISKKPYTILVFIMGFILAVGPLIIYILQNLEPFLSRSSQVFLFDPGVMIHLLNKYNVNSETQVILRQIQETLLMFNKVSDSSTQFGFQGPMFNSYLSPLLILGIGSALRRRREIGVVLLVIWMILMMVLGSVLTVDAPFWPRLVGIVPAAALMAALAIDQIFNMVKIYPSQNIKRILFILFVYWIIFNGWVNWDQYYQSVKTNASHVAFLGRYIQHLPEDVTVCGFLDDPPLNVREITFLTWPRKLVDFAPDTPNEDLKNCDGSSVVWVLLPEDTDRLQDIYRFWPEGNLITYESRYNIFTYIFYLTGETPPTILPQDIVMQKDLQSYQWKYSVVLAGLTLVGSIFWFVFRKKSIKWNRLFKLPFKKKKTKVEDLKTDQNIISSPVKKLLSNHKFYFYNIELGRIISSLFGEFKKLLDPEQFEKLSLKKINIKTIGKRLTFLIPIALAYIGQMILNAGREEAFTIPFLKQLPISENQRLIMAGVVFLISSLLWVLWIRFIRLDSRIIQESKKHIPKASVGDVPNLKKLDKTFLFGSLICLAISSIAYMIQGENAFVRWLWVIGLVCLIIYFLRQRKQIEKSTGNQSPAFNNSHKWSLGILLVIAFILRIYRLYDIPLDLSTDMASIGIYARDYLLGNQNQIFGTGWFYMPKLVFLPYAFSMWLVGNNLFGLYFCTVVIGTLSIIGVYLLIWRLFDNHRLALLTAVLITINPAHIEYSRIPSYIDPWLFGFFSLFFLIDGMKGRRNTSFAFSGILAAFAFMGYPSGRAILPIIGLVFVSAFLFKREWIKENYSGLFWLIGCFFFALGPNLVYIISDWETFMKRADEVFVFSAFNHSHVTYTYETNRISVILWEQVKRTLFTFNFFNDKSPQFSYPYPIFNPIIAPLMVLGFFQALWKWKQPEYLIILTSFVFILVTGGILTIDTPTWCRLLPAIPLGAFFIAIVFEKILAYTFSFSKRLLPLLVAISMVGLVITVGIQDWKQYINYVSVETRPVVFVARFIDALPDEFDVCGMTDGYNVFWAETEFLGWPHTLIEVPGDIPLISEEICPGENLVWIVSPAYETRLDDIQHIWPNGELKKHYKFEDEFLFISYLVTNPSLP